MLVRLLQTGTVLVILSFATAAGAAESAISADSLSIVDYLTDKDGKYLGPTLEQNVAKMDTDKNGFADVTEVRAFLELKHGKGYQKALLDRWEIHAKGGSCPIPFAKEFLSESKN
jgi:hypothetical protein